MEFYSNLWDSLREKHKKALNMNIYANMAERGVMSRLRFKGLPDIYIEEVLKRKVLREGMAGLCKNGEEYIAGSVGFVGGEMYFDGVLSTAQITDSRGRIYIFENWRENPNIAIWRANSLNTPDYNIAKMAYELAEVDTSLYALVDFARAHAFLLADDEAQAQAFRRGIEDVKAGKIHTVVRGGLSKPSSDSYLVELGNVEASKWLADLDIHAHTIANKFYFLEGCELGTTIKKAQQTEDEVNKGYNASRVLCEEALTYAQLFCKACKGLGLDVTVDFSDCWKILELSDEAGILEDGEGNEPDDVAEEQQETPQDATEQPKEDENDNN